MRVAVVVVVLKLVIVDAGHHGSADFK